MGSISITTAEHGNIVYDVKNTNWLNGCVKWASHKCYSTAEEATKYPISITSMGHKIIVTLCYKNNLESFTLNTGDNKLLSISHSDKPSKKAYVYLIVN